MRHADSGYTPNKSFGGTTTTARHGAGKLGSLAALGTVLQRAAKDTLFWEGDPADHVFQVIRGTACLYKLMPDGRRQVARFCHTGDLIGLTVGDEYPYTAGALTELSVSRIRRVDLETQVEGERALRRIVVDAIASELSLAQDQLLLLGRKSAVERVATFLCAMREQAILDGGDGRSVFLPMTRVDIADFLGLTHETVCRVMASLKAQGLIATSEPHRIVIRSLETLEDIAEGDAEQRLCA
jgi:CRP/FNR family transcriptional regulator